MQFRQPIRACGSPIIASRGPLPPNPLRNEAKEKKPFAIWLKRIETVFLGILSERGRAEPPLDFIQASAPILARYRGCLLSSASTTDSSLTYHLDKDVPPLS